jgi:succinate dehydrogenase flavin-adding protein (antitoxin of CptAB toxin-antitoxin module)
MYNFEIQNFVDVNGVTVYPINYMGSNYLPVRAIAGLMGETIEWDPDQRRIFISAGITETEHPEVQLRVKEFDQMLADIAAIFDRATARVLSLQNAMTMEEFQQLVNYASADVLEADAIVQNLMNMSISGFSEMEITIYNSLLAYADSTARYALITENIVYMAFRGQDFSIFAEIFLTFAVDTQAKFETARSAIRAFHSI